MVEKDTNQEQEVIIGLEEDTMAQDFAMDAEEGEDMESFQELYEQSLVNIQEGEVIHGKIIQITDDFVMVDIGYKSEGQIRIHEFRDENGDVQAAIGDEVDALLEYREDDDGAIILSKDKAEKIKIWDDISQIYNNDGVIDGIVVSKV
jgi:small subunit ribosomal protein S1